MPKTNEKNESDITDSPNKGNDQIVKAMVQEIISINQDELSPKQGRKQTQQIDRPNRCVRNIAEEQYQDELHEAIYLSSNMSNCSSRNISNKFSSKFEQVEELREWQSQSKTILNESLKKQNYISNLRFQNAQTQQNKSFILENTFSHEPTPCRYQASRKQSMILKVNEVIPEQDEDKHQHSASSSSSSQEQLMDKLIRQHIAKGNKDEFTPIPSLVNKNINSTINFGSKHQSRVLEQTSNTNLSTSQHKWNSSREISFKSKNIFNSQDTKIFNGSRNVFNSQNKENQSFHINSTQQEIKAETEQSHNSFSSSKQHGFNGQIPFANQVAQNQFYEDKLTQKAFNNPFQQSQASRYQSSKDPFEKIPSIFNSLKQNTNKSLNPFDQIKTIINPFAANNPIASNNPFQTNSQQSYINKPTNPFGSTQQSYGTNNSFATNQSNKTIQFDCQKLQPHQQVNNLKKQTPMTKSEGMKMEEKPINEFFFY